VKRATPDSDFSLSTPGELESEPDDFSKVRKSNDSLLQEAWFPRAKRVHGRCALVGLRPAKARRAQCNSSRDAVDGRCMKRVFSSGCAPGGEETHVTEQSCSVFGLCCNERVRSQVRAKLCVSCMCTGRRSPWQPVATVEIHFVRVVVGRWQRQPLQHTTALTTGALPTAK
jgi:hypothetical protein